MSVYIDTKSTQYTHTHTCCVTKHLTLCVINQDECLTAVVLMVRS